MNRWKSLIGIVAASLLVSASAPTPAAPSGTTAGIAAAPAPAPPTPGTPTPSTPAAPDAPVLKVIPPDADSVAKWCTAEQQGAHALAEQLRRRDRELDEASATLALREQELGDAQKNLDRRLEELTRLRAEIAGMLDGADAETDKKVADLVKMVEANRPTSAAPIVAALDPDLAVRVIERMNPQKAGKLLAELPPRTAASLAERLTRPLPVEAP